MKKFEYTVEHFYKYEVEFLNHLKHLGEDGWELILETEIEGFKKLIFKRQVL